MRSIRKSLFKAEESNKNNSVQVIKYSDNCFAPLKFTPKSLKTIENCLKISLNSISKVFPSKKKENQPQEDNLKKITKHSYSKLYIYIQ
jgi:hypothetical protein